jgi:hypothetical protein
MKVRIKSFNGELPNYLNEENIYRIDKSSDYTFILEDDEGCLWMCLFNNCPNLNGGSWEVVE